MTWYWQYFPKLWTRRWPKALAEGMVKKLYPKANVHFGPELWSVPIGMMLREDNDSTRLALNASLVKFQQGAGYTALSNKYSGRSALQGVRTTQTG